MTVQVALDWADVDALVPAQPLGHLAVVAAPVEAVVQLPSGANVAFIRPWVAQILEGWGVLPAQSSRWCAGVERLLPSRVRMTMVLRLHPGRGLVTLEVVHDGKILYGVDEWV